MIQLTVKEGTKMKELNMNEMKQVSGGNTTPFGIGMPTPMKPIEYPKMPPFPDYVPVILIP
jgi:bacteriocin-like protein